MTQSSRRPLVAGVLTAAAVLSVGLLSGCSAGQIAQTAQVEPGVAGLNTQAPGYQVYLRNATVEYLGPKGYGKGSNAPLSLWIFNNTTETIALTGMDGPAPVVLSTGGNTAAPCVVPRSPAPSTSPTVVRPSSVPASVSPKPSGSASAPAKSAVPAASASVASSAASASASSSASPSAPGAVGAATFQLTIPAMGCVELSRRAAQYLQVVNLPGALNNASTVAAVLHFTDHSGQSFTIGTQNQPLQIPVAVPESALPRR